LNNFEKKYRVARKPAQRLYAICALVMATL
jgi:hypothetical protein